MKAGETSLLKLMDGVQQFIVPIYQRTYSWTSKQCNQLWKDIMQITYAADDRVHFIGAVVYIDLGAPKGSGPQQLLLIDGQQRLTTLSLLLAALVRHIKENDLSGILNPNKIKNHYLFNNDENGTDKIKIILTEQDKETYIKILNETEHTLQNPSEQMIENFKLFQRILQASDESVQKVFEGINRLMLVSVALDKFHDNPQLIFESMNSTGKDLSQADLIRNYILMGLSPDEQNFLYTTYWRPMEQGFGQQGYTNYFDYFIRDFLTCKNPSGRICKIGEVYEEFKLHHKIDVSNEHLLKDVFTYAQYYIRIHLEKESDLELKALWSELKMLDVSVSYPFLMSVYDDYINGIITKAEFLTIIKMTINYVFRRVICEIPTNSLNKTFSTFHGKIKKDNYLNSVLAEYVVKDSYRAFPTDEEFNLKFATKEIFKLRVRNYIFEALENQGHKEPISILGTGYSIEHIMPQNPELRKEWREMLGENWQEIQKTYLHTIGNLTLTGYNSEMSDKPFYDKQMEEKGFKNSKLMLNAKLGSMAKWGVDEIKNRAQELSAKALLIWKYPDVSEEEIDKYKKIESCEPKYVSIEHYQKMAAEVADIYFEIDRKIKDLDTGIRVEYKKDYIAYKLDTNFVDIEPYKGHLKLWVNMPFSEVSNKTTICKDVTNIGHMGNGDVEIKVTQETNMTEVFNIIIQSYNYAME